MECLQRKPSNFRVRLAHLVRHHIPIDIHGRANVGMPHQLLLNGQRSPHRIHPRAIAVAHRVSADLADASIRSCFQE